MARGISKKNEEKLKLYFKKRDDIKSNNQQGKDDCTKSQDDPSVPLRKRK